MNWNTRTADNGTFIAHLSRIERVEMPIVYINMCCIIDEQGDKEGFKWKGKKRQMSRIMRGKKIGKGKQWFIKITNIGEDMFNWGFFY